MQKGKYDVLTGSERNAEGRGDLLDGGVWRSIHIDWLRRVANRWCPAVAHAQQYEIIGDSTQRGSWEIWRVIRQLLAVLSQGCLLLNGLVWPWMG